MYAGSVPLSAQAPEPIAQPVSHVAAKEEIKEPVIPKPDCEVYKTEIKKYWPKEEWDNALLVVQKESGCKDTAVGPTNDHGGWQIHDGLKVYGPKVYDPVESTKIAYYDFYLPRGYRPWYAVKGILF